MDVFRAEISHPKRKSLLHVTNLKEYIRQYKANKETATKYLHSFLSLSKVPSRHVMGDMFLELMQQTYAGVRSTDVSGMTDLCTRITDYIWYTAPHSNKFSKCSAVIPLFFEPLFPFNKLKRHNHTAKQLQKAILLHYLDGILTLMEKLFTNGASFAVIKIKIVSFHQVLNTATILKAA